MLSFRLRHIGIAVDSLETAAELYETLFGVSLIAGPFNDPAQGVRVAFYVNDRFLACPLELVEPLDRTSPVSKILHDMKRSSAYHMCVEVENLDEALESLKAVGSVLVAAPVPAVAFAGRRIAWVYLKTRHLMEVLEA